MEDGSGGAADWFEEEVAAGEDFEEKLDWEAGILYCN